MWRVQTPTFYFENLAEVIDTFVFGRMILGVNDAEPIYRHDMAHSLLRYLKNQHRPTIFRQQSQIGK